MPAPRVTIDQLPEQLTPVSTDLLVVQDGATTKKMLVNRLTTASDAAVAAHLADTVNAHMAGAIGASPNAAPMTGTDVQTQLQQAATALASGGGGGSYTDEQVRDVVASFVVAGTNMTVIHNDGANTLTFSAAGGGGGGGITTEDAVDAVAAALVGGTGINIVYDDTGNQITITATAGGGIDTEAAIDAVAAALVAGNNIDVTYNDAAGTITIDVEALVIADVANLQATLDGKASTAALAAHEADTTAIHGIPDTTLLETTAGSTAKVAAHTGASSGAHAATAVSFVPVGTVAATNVQAAIAEVASEALSAAALAAHEADTTAIHGIANTALLVLNGGGIATVRALTQAEYDALIPPDANTFYVIT